MPFGLPVDMAPDADGGLYFISLGQLLNGVNRSAYIYYLDRKRKAIRTGITVRSSGGITLTDGGRNLLVSEMTENRIVRFTVTAPGRLSWSGVFVRLPDVTAPPHGMERNAGPDALAVDSAGTVFICHSGASRILLLSRTGTLQQVIKTSLPFVTGICFGRLDNVAYITAVSSLSDPPFSGAVFEFTRKRTRLTAP
jgi:sugar lactone lactonase YvrE